MRQRGSGIRITDRREKARLYTSCLCTPCFSLARLCNQTSECHPTFPVCRTLSRAFQLTQFWETVYYTGLALSSSSTQVRRRRRKSKETLRPDSPLSFCSHHSSSCGNSLIFIAVKDKPNRLFELVITYFSWCVISLIHFEKLQSGVFSVGLSNEEPITVLLDVTNAGSDCCKLT